MSKKMKKSLLPRGWDILLQAVLGASCSKFWEEKVESACSSTLSPSPLFHFIVAEEHDKSVVPP
jgi:hypothetical protein